MIELQPLRFIQNLHRKPLYGTYAYYTKDSYFHIRRSPSTGRRQPSAGKYQWTITTTQYLQKDYPLVAAAAVQAGFGWSDPAFFPTRSAALHAMTMFLESID